MVPQHLHPVKVASNAIAQRMRARPARSVALDSRAHGLGQQSQVPRALPAAMAAATAKHPSRVRQLHSRLQYLKALVPPQGQQQQQQHLQPAVHLSRLPLMTLRMCLVHGASRMARGTVMTKSWSRLQRMRHSCSSSHAQMWLTTAVSDTEALHGWLTRRSTTHLLLTWPVPYYHCRAGCDCSLGVCNCHICKIAQLTTAVPGHFCLCTRLCAVGQDCRAAVGLGGTLWTACVPRGPAAGRHAEGRTLTGRHQQCGF